MAAVLQYETSLKGAATPGFATARELVAHATPAEVVAFFRGPAPKAWVNQAPWKRGRKAGGINRV